MISNVANEQEYVKRARVMSWDKVAGGGKPVRDGKGGWSMKLRCCVAILVLGLMLVSMENASCEDAVSMSDWKQIVEKIGANGNVNWSAGYIEAVGIGAPPERFMGKPQGRPMALRAAEQVAKRNLLEITKGVRIDSTTTVRDYAVESDVINSQVEGVIRGSQVVKKEYMSDGTVEVTVRMPLFGNFSQVIMPKIMDKNPPAATSPAEPERPVSEPAAPAPPPPAALPAPVVYTGLVVDARGIQTRPAMAPKILDEDGQEVYGSMLVDREFAVQQGMTGYARELSSAQSNSRVTNNPLTVKALRTQGAGKSDIVIGTQDAKAIRAAADNMAFIKKCRVMIVLD